MSFRAEREILYIILFTRKRFLLVPRRNDMSLHQPLTLNQIAAARSKAESGAAGSEETLTFVFKKTTKDANIEITKSAMTQFNNNSVFFVKSFAHSVVKIFCSSIIRDCRATLASR